MSDNEKAIIDNLTRAVADANYYRAQLDSLRSFIDDVDVRYADTGYGAFITTEQLRAIFCWPLCEKAQDIMLEREALAAGKENAWMGARGN